jgi:hypothetical protein
MNNGNNMPSQSPRDRILWILANSGGKMERNDLRRSVGMRLADLYPSLKSWRKKAGSTGYPHRQAKR